MHSYSLYTLMLTIATASLYRVVQKHSRPLHLIVHVFRMPESIFEIYGILWEHFKLFFINVMLKRVAPEERPQRRFSYQKSS